MRDPKNNTYYSFEQKKQSYFVILGCLKKNSIISKNENFLVFHILATFSPLHFSLYFSYFTYFFFFSVLLSQFLIKTRIAHNRLYCVDRESNKSCLPDRK